MKVVSVGALDLDGGEFADPQGPARHHMDGAINLGGIALAAAFGHRRADRVDDDLLAGADMAFETARRDYLLALHETVPALLLDLIRHGVAEIVGGRPFHG